MQSSNSSERQSAPTGAQTSELKQEASRPLGVASCSDSSFWVFNPNKNVSHVSASVVLYAKAIRDSNSPPFAVIIEGIEGGGALAIMDAFTSVGVSALRVTSTNDIDANAVLKLSPYLGKIMPLLNDLIKAGTLNVMRGGDEKGVNQVSDMNTHRSEISLNGMKINVINILAETERDSVSGGDNRCVHSSGDSLLSGERLAVAPAKWKLEFKKDVIAGCHERLVR